MILKKIIKYVIGKFFELGVLAGLLFYIAQQVQPEEYSKLLPLLLSISISSIIFSGLGSSYIKISTIDKFTGANVLIDYLYQTLILGGAVFLFGLLFLSGHELFIFSSLILLFNSFRSFGQSCYRVQLNEMGLIKFNLIYPVIASLVFYFSHHLLGYPAINAYIIGVFIGMAFSAFYIVFNVFNQCTIGLRFRYHFTNLKQWKTPLQHLILNSSVFIFIFSDKFIALEIMDNDFIGQFQLYENFTNLFYMGISSCLYLLSPYLLKKYEAEHSFDRKGLFQILFFFGLLVLAVIYSVISKFLIGYIYPAYVHNILFFEYQLAIKFFALTLFLPSIYFMRRNKEKLFILIIYTFFILVLLNIFYQKIFVSTSFEYIIQNILVFLCFASLILNILMYKWNSSHAN